MAREPGALGNLEIGRFQGSRVSEAHRPRQSPRATRGAVIVIGKASSDPAPRRDARACSGRARRTGSECLWSTFLLFLSPAGTGRPGESERRLPGFRCRPCVGVAGVEQEPPEWSGTVVARQAVRRDESKASARTRERHGTLDEELIRVAWPPDCAEYCRECRENRTAAVMPSSCRRASSARSISRAGCQSRHQSPDSLTGRRGRRRTLREIRAAMEEPVAHGGSRHPCKRGGRGGLWQCATSMHDVFGQHSELGAATRSFGPLTGTRDRRGDANAGDRHVGRGWRAVSLPPDVAWSAVVALREVAPDGQPHAKRILPLIQREQGELRRRAGGSRPPGVMDEEIGARSDAYQTVPCHDVVIEESKRPIGGERGEPQRQSCELDGGRVRIHAGTGTVGRRGA